jgi:sulfatase maturation enzyme AslB (radical SAM superfamily)
MITCIDVFKNLNVGVRNGSFAISPCCIAATESVSTVNFVDNQYLKDIRNSWSNGQWPEACSACKYAEEQSIPSRRQGSNQWYSDHGYNNTDVELVRLDYWTGDTCNLACVICIPEYSSKWKQELNFPIELKQSVVNEFWKEIDLSAIKFIHFNGGEPLLSKEHVKFLEVVPNKSSVHLNYNTNGTIRPSQHLLDLWKKFKLVQLDISIDDIGPRFEYQRYPAKWNQLTENLQWLIQNCPHNCMFATNTSVGILNHDNVDNLMSWLSSNFYVNNYTDPIAHRTQFTIGLFSLSGAQIRAKKIIDFLDQCDQRRGTNWKSTFPDLLNYLESK